MHETIAFWRMVRWPVIFVGLAATTHQPWASAAVVFLLAFHDDVSVVLRRRRLVVKLPGFEGTVGESEPDPDSNPRTADRSIAGRAGRQIQATQVLGRQQAGS